MRTAEARLLLRLWLHAPRRIATIAPSGATVCDALIGDAVATRPDAGWVIELGAGTGPVTRALLDRGVGANRLLAVEADPTLHAHLRDRFEDRVLACHDASDLPALFERRGVDRVAAVVSTLPILNMPASTQRAILDGCFARATANTSFTQITYLPGSPVRRRRLERWGYTAQIAGFVWSNLPPSTIWRYRRI